MGTNGEYSAMSIKQKLLDSLNVTLEDISMERLIDILLDTYKAKCQYIKKLEGENAHEREQLESARKAIGQEMDRIRCDPTLLCAKEYNFISRNKIKFTVQIVNSKVILIERVGPINYPMEEIY